MGNDCNLCDHNKIEKQPEFKHSLLETKTIKKQKQPKAEKTTSAADNFQQELNSSNINENNEENKEIKPIYCRYKLPAYEFNSGSVYEGEWKVYTNLKDNDENEDNEEDKFRNMRDGYGVQTWSDGAKYEGIFILDKLITIGEWRDNKAEGKGKFWHANGNIYEGYGIFYHNSGAVYEGNWIHDKQEGYGVETWPDGSKYSGYFSNGKKNGQGVYTVNDGGRYEGDWKENKIEGYVIRQLIKREFIFGRIKEDMRVIGKIISCMEKAFTSGRMEEDMKDQKHGYGVYVWANLNRYEGYWKNGKQQGKGKLIMPNGKYKFGLWENGKFMKWIDGQNDSDENPEAKNEFFE